jgi:arsenate reductase (glutaredoxin)
MIDMELAVTFRIYHNPQCSKSRAALALLEERGIDIEVIEYLRHPPAKATLRSLLAKLDVPPLDLVRPNEPGYAALAAGADAEQVLDFLVREPRALQRPILESANSAVIGRPPERVLELIA